jgi:hypothetical protein
LSASWTAVILGLSAIVVVLSSILGQTDDSQPPRRPNSHPPAESSYTTLRDSTSIDKPAVFAETFRVLRPGGRLGVSDIVAEDRLTAEQRAERGSYVGCIAGALSQTEFETQLAEAGFSEVSVTFTHSVGDGIHSAIIKATRPAEATAAVPAGARQELPVVQQSDCC